MTGGTSSAFGRSSLYFLWGLKRNTILRTVDDAPVRGPSGHHPVHSGGFRGALRGAYHYANGVFRCGQCNIILALTDIGPGDGATMVIPGSHKSNFAHPSSSLLFAIFAAFAVTLSPQGHPDSPAPS